MSIKLKLPIVLILIGIASPAFAQYPKIPADAKAKSDSILAASERLSEEAREKAKVIVFQEEEKGKPYIPWAGRPSDLPQAGIPAFPGAEGGGMFSYGGRGGKVITVTSLADRGPGTLRAALEEGGARIIVFNVAGIIQLKSPLIIRAPYVTIAGQTAPGDGICVAGETVWINTHDVVIRHMRFRRGETFVDRKSTRLNSSHVRISYAVFCLKKKTTNLQRGRIVMRW